MAIVSKKNHLLVTVIALFIFKKIIDKVTMSQVVKVHHLILIIQREICSDYRISPDLMIIKFQSKVFDQVQKTLFVE